MALRIRPISPHATPSSQLSLETLARADHPRLYRQLLSDVSSTPLPPRANRSNPRVVKRKMSKFGVKTSSHRAWPQPTNPFHEAVVLLI